MDSRSIFNINSDSEFEVKALEVFKYQYLNVPVYREFCNLLNRNPDTVNSLKEIPFLPIEFFKSRKILSHDQTVEEEFSSSGTTGAATSTHYVADLRLYEESFRRAFQLFYGDITGYTVLALLPAYLERKGSSLIYMVNELIEASGKPESGFYLHNLEELVIKLRSLEEKKEKTLLIGVSFALLDLVEQYNLQLKYTTVMETGGMKGRRKELIRAELHHILKEGLGLDRVHSEYGMTELLSQGYSKGEGFFECPPWMQVLIRDTEDPLSYLPYGRSGGINVIDLANVHSCAFIATQDLGKLHKDGSFEVLGRFDNSDIRGCNLMVL